MRKPNIAILGATGVVGREITKIIEELPIIEENPEPVEEIRRLPVTGM